MVFLADNISKYLSIVFSAATEYEKQLLGNQFLFIARDVKSGEFSFYEAWFRERQFQHLTGIEPAHGINAERFFYLCKTRRLRREDIVTLPTGQSAQKLDILLPFMNLTGVAKMMGDFGHAGNYLYTEKLSGTTWGCMGFVFDEESGFYVANTLLKGDVRDLAARTKQIVAIYKKRIGDSLYPTSPVSCAKPLRNKKLVWPSEIASKIEPLPSWLSDGG